MERALSLVQIVDAAMAEANARAGKWIACRPGCAECCMGPFGISRADAARLQEGLRQLELSDAGRAARVRDRARAAAARLRHLYPADPVQGPLEQEGEADGMPCPALDPETGLCELYDARPLTCRTFGPAVRAATGEIAVCELCFEGASEAEIERCAVELDERVLAEEGETLVAFALEDR